MRIRFLSDQTYESWGPGKGPKFPAGTILAEADVAVALGLREQPSRDWITAWLNRWLQRGVAVDDEAEPNIVATDVPSDARPNLNDMTRAQLDEHAAKLGIDASKAPNKGEVIALIEAAKIV